MTEPRDDYYFMSRAELQRLAIVRGVPRQDREWGSTSELRDIFRAMDYDQERAEP